MVQRIRPKTALRRAVLPVMLAVVLTTAGCAGDPWVDSRREAGQVEPVGRSTPDRPAICFAPGNTSRDALLAMAQEVCAETNRTAAFVGVERWQCRLTTPHRAYFECR